jgi:hypothetical protein
MDGSQRFRWEMPIPETLIKSNVVGTASRIAANRGTAYTSGMKELNWTK